MKSEILLPTKLSKHEYNLAVVMPLLVPHIHLHIGYGNYSTQKYYFSNGLRL